MEDVYYVGTHRDGFRPGIPAKVIGVKFGAKPNTEREVRLCYHVKYQDNVEDMCVVSDDTHYKLVQFKDVLDGNLPKVNW